jgi:hypothetical protein
MLLSVTKIIAICQTLYPLAKVGIPKEPPPPPFTPPEKLAREKRTCAIAGCDGYHHAKGLCGAHYQRRRAQRPSGTICMALACQRPTHSKGLCQRHYGARWRAANKDKVAASYETWKASSLTARNADRRAERLNPKLQETTGTYL